MDLQKSELLFVRGDHAALLAETLDRPDFRRPDEGLALIIGSLCFIGRLSEAQTLLGIWRPWLPTDELAAALAYVAIASARQGALQACLPKLRELGSLMRLAPSPLVVFFRSQAMAFYNWRRHRLPLALHFAEQALAAAFQAEFFFGRALATDMMGHLQINLGQIQKGMASLEKSHQYFSSLGNCQHVHVIETALLGYQLEYKPFGADSLAHLRQRMSQLSADSNNYSLSFLYLELAHQLGLRGDLPGAALALDEAGSLIQRFGHRRHQGLLLFRKAYLAHLNGRDQTTLQSLDDLLIFAERDRDERLLIKVKGLQAFLKNPSQGTSKADDQAFRKFGYAMAMRMDRRKSGQKQSAEWAQDAMGDFMDSLESQDLGDLEKIQQILKSGLLSFLFRFLPVARQDRVLYFDLEPQSLFIFDQGEIQKAEGAITPQMQKFVRLLVDGPKTKAALVEGIWDYSYHPLRHDQLIYGLVYRLRLVLCEREDWIQALGEGYALRPDIQVNFFQLYGNLPLPTKELEPHPSTVDLNIRQLKILQYLQQHDTVDLQTCVELFQTSKVTASRDLSQMTEKGVLQRTGKGRNTCYGLPKYKPREQGLSL